MKFPLYIDKASNGYIVTATSLHAEFKPDTDEIYVFQRLDELFDFLKDHEHDDDIFKPEPTQEEAFDAATTFGDDFENIEVAG